LYDELLQRGASKRARVQSYGPQGEIDEVRTNEYGCVLNLNDPERCQEVCGRLGTDRSRLLPSPSLVVNNLGKKVLA